MELVLLSFAVIFMASVVVALWAGIGTVAYHITVLTGVLSLTGGIMYYVVARSIVEYFGLYGVGKMLHREKRLTQQGVRQLCHVRGGLQEVCDYINKEENAEQYIIVDDTLEAAGTLENGKWIAK